MAYMTGSNWHVIVDSPRQAAPRRVSRHTTEGEARAEALRLNRASSEPGRPLYFVELWETSSVLDVERSGTR